MSIEVHSPHLVNTLVADAERRALKPILRGGKTHASAAAPRSRGLPVAESSHQSTAETKLKTEEIEKECYKQLLSSELLYRDLTITEKTFVKELDSKLDENKRKHKQKYDSLYSKWDDEIFNSVKADINRKLSGKEFNTLDNKRRRLFSRYLAACNAKGTVFLDVINREEYDPLCLAKRNISTTVPSYRDPTKLVQNEALTSKTIENDCGVKKSSFLPDRPRSDTRGSCIEWIKMPIRDVDSSIRQRTRQRMIDKTVCSQPSMNDLNLPRRKQAVPSYSLHRPLSQMFF